MTKFLRFGRNYSVAYCLLIVGCLLFSSEFFTVHHSSTSNPESNNNNNNHNNILSVNKHSMIMPIDSQNNSSAIVYSKVVKVTNATMKNPPQPIDITKLQSSSSSSSSSKVNVKEGSQSNSIEKRSINNDNNNNNDKQKNFAIPPPLSQPPNKEPQKKADEMAKNSSELPLTSNEAVQGRNNVKKDKDSINNNSHNET
ncbi:unnamed protein product [Trichobilharzia szidati]|nr:unnamed protein product [Trichobilharzia szidati]